VIAVVLPLSLLRRKTDGDIYLSPNSLWDTSIISDMNVENCYTYRVGYGSLDVYDMLEYIADLS